MPGDPTQPIFHLLVLGARIGGNVNFRFGVRDNANFRVFDTNKLVYPKQNYPIGGIAQREHPK